MVEAFFRFLEVFYFCAFTVIFIPPTANRKFAPNITQTWGPRRGEKKETEKEKKGKRKRREKNKGNAKRYFSIRFPPYEKVLEITQIFPIRMKALPCAQHCLCNISVAS